MSSDNYAKIEQALARQRREEESRQSARDRAAHETCASLHIADLASIISDALKASERNLLAHVRRMLVPGDEYRRREKQRAFNVQRRLTELESQVRLLAKAAKKT